MIWVLLILHLTAQPTISPAAVTFQYFTATSAQSDCNAALAQAMLQPSTLANCTQVALNLTPTPNPPVVTPPVVTPPVTPPAPQAISPGVGSLKDSAGNTVAITGNPGDASGTALVNSSFSNSMLAVRGILVNGFVVILGLDGNAYQFNKGWVKLAAKPAGL